jgi:hypothetical protein
VFQIFKSTQERGATEGLEKELGNIIATFSYPATIAKDVYAQINFDAAGNPYTRTLLPGEKDRTDIYGERNFISDIFNSELLKAQATRFLLDSNMFSYNQSRTPISGKEGYDYKLYSIFTPYAIGSYNPITKQFGMSQEPPSTGLQKEITRLGLKDYKLYTKKKVKNNSLAHQVEYNLSQKLYAMFDVWREQGKIGGDSEYSELSYNELDELPRSAEFKNNKKIEILTAWINQYIDYEEAAVKAVFESALNNPKLKKRAIGYIRNSYELETAKIGKKSLDSIISRYPDKFNDAKSAREYLERSTDIIDEINRRQLIIDVVSKEEEDTDIGSVIPFN